MKKGKRPRVKTMEEKMVGVKNIGPRRVEVKKWGEIGSGKGEILKMNKK